jgi:hypothetical protein
VTSSTGASSGSVDGGGFVDSLRDREEARVAEERDERHRAPCIREDQRRQRETRIAQPVELGAEDDVDEAARRVVEPLEQSRRHHAGQRPGEQEQRERAAPPDALSA